MNFAFSSLLILLILVPGLIFFRFYYSEEFSKEYFKTSPFEVISTSLIPSVVFHLIGGAVSSWTTGYSIDLQTVGFLLIGTNESALIKDSITNIQDNVYLIVKYNLLLWGFAGIAGKASRTIIRRSGLDRKQKLFRFRNRWHYILTGELLQFPRVPMEETDLPDFTFIDALVETQEGTIIYKGILADYDLTGSGDGLETIYLIHVERRYLSKDRGDWRYRYRNKKITYYEMPGELFILKYDEIVNLNVTYYALQDEDDK